MVLSYMVLSYMVLNLFKESAKMSLELVGLLLELLLELLLLLLYAFYHVLIWGREAPPYNPFEGSHTGARGCRPRALLAQAAFRLALRSDCVRTDKKLCVGPLVRTFARSWRVFSLDLARPASILLARAASRTLPGSFFRRFSQLLVARGEHRPTSTKHWQEWYETHIRASAHRAENAKISIHERFRPRAAQRTPSTGVRGAF